MYPRRRDYPKEIQVGQTVYRIRFCSKATMLTLDGDPKTIGFCCEASETIYIAIGLKPKDRFETPLHELLHAVSFEYKIPIPHKLIYGLEAPLARLVLDALAG